MLPAPCSGLQPAVNSSSLPHPLGHGGANPLRKRQHACTTAHAPALAHVRVNGTHVRHDNRLPRSPLAVPQHVHGQRMVRLAAVAAEVDPDAIVKDLHAIDSKPSQQDHPKQQRQAGVPGVHVVTDPEQLDLLGEGLPVITGPEWPEAYWQALKALAVGKKVPVPKPHPKFNLQDLERISQQGPRFEDVVLQHAERMGNGSSTACADGGDGAIAYSYVPRTVLGDWRFEVEPNWLQLQQMDFLSFYNGLRERNWTSPTFNPRAAPWRVQMFQCAYSAVSAWPGMRALVTRADDGSQFWVDLPESGEEQAPEEDYVSGYGPVLQQLYQAYRQRLSKRAAQELQQQNFLLPGKHPYVCPGDRLLDVSYHWTDNPLEHPVEAFLAQPSWEAFERGLQWAVARSGIYELKALRDQLWEAYVPKVEWKADFDYNSAGPMYFIICLTLGIVVPALRRNRVLDIKILEEDPGAAMEFARSKSTARKEGLTGVQFTDVAGLGPILAEVLEVVEFLRDPKTFSKLGARPPKGILLEGDPGTGKTLTAKALAGEAMVPFYQMSGTEFTEGIVGLGAARVRDLFKRARANAPCVIFVDELDALGLKRAEGDGSGKVNEEREQTLNQLLTEMDGFTPDTGVVFIGATNRADLLDPALLRPGRFDRKIHMPKPDTEGRYEILKLNLRNKQLSPDVDLMQIARDLPGLVGADLANVVNEAQMNAVRAGRPIISARDLYAGIDRFTQGELRPSLPTAHKRPTLAFAAKEVGTALVATLLRARHGRVEAVERVSIQPKGRTISRTLFQRGTDEDYQLMTRGKLLDRMRVALAGSIAVRVVLGEETNFGIPDIMRAHGMAEKLVFYYGMSELGITMYAQQPYHTDFLIGQNRPRKVVSTDAMDAMSDWPTRNEDFRFTGNDPSDVTWHRYTDEVRRIMKSAYEEVWALMEEHRDALWAGVKALGESRDLLGSELRDIFDAHPPRVLSPEERPALSDMRIFTAGRTDVWPYNIDWLNDTYPVPYWARKQIQERKQQQEEAAMQAAGTP